MAQSVVAALAGINRLEMPQLIAAGVFQRCREHQEDGRDYVKFDPGRDASSYFDEWVERGPVPSTHAEFALYRRIRRLCGILGDMRHCDRILEAVFQKLSEIGNFSTGEVRSLIAIDAATVKDVSAWLGRRNGEYSRQRHAIREDVPVTWEMFEAALPPQFANLPRTCLDDKRPFAYDRPPLRIRHRVWRLKRLFDCGALYALVYTVQLRRPEQIAPALVVFARVEEIMAAHAPSGTWTAATYVQALRRYALDREILPDDVPAVRDHTVRFWRIIVERLHRYCRKHDRRDEIGLRGLLPPKFVIDGQFRKELRDQYGSLRGAGLDRRKADSNRASAELYAILDAAQNRRDEVRAFGNAMRSAAARLGSDEDYLDFPVKVPVLDELGRHEGGGFQMETFRLWRLGSAWQSLSTVATSASFSMDFDKRQKRGHANTTVVEHLDTRGCGGITPRKSWIVRLAEVGALSSPGFLAIEIRERRHQLLARLGLPGVKSHSGGTLTFERERGCLASHGLENGRTFVALAEIERAVRYGHLSLDIVSQSLRRGHELRQLLRLAWERKDVIPGKIHFSQDVWPKVEPHTDLAETEKVPVTVLAATVDEALDLCDLQIADCGFDRFPEMQPVDQLRWKCPAGEYIMSHNGHAFHRHDLNLFLRILLAGWPPFTLHDFRYAGAEDAEFDDEPAGAIQESLGHKSPASSVKYRRLSDEAQAVKDARTEGRREDAVDARAHRRRVRGLEQERRA